MFNPVSGSAELQMVRAGAVWCGCPIRAAVDLDAGLRHVERFSEAVWIMTKKLSDSRSPVLDMWLAPHL